MTGGASLTMQTLRNNFLVSVDRYVEIDFENFASIIDAMGGIEVEISQAEADYLNEVRGENLSAGTNHMRGALALYYSRMRYLDSDFARTSRQRQVIGCMMDKIQQMGPVEAVSFIWNCMPYITTNLSNGELTALATQALDITNYETGTLYIPTRTCMKTTGMKPVTCWSPIWKPTRTSSRNSCIRKKLHPRSPKNQATQKERQTVWKTKRSISPPPSITPRGKRTSATATARWPATPLPATSGCRALM